MNVLIVCLVVLLLLYVTTWMFLEHHRVVILLLLLQMIWQIILVSLLISDWQLSKELAILLLAGSIILIPVFYYSNWLEAQILLFQQSVVSLPRRILAILVLLCLGGIGIWQLMANDNQLIAKGMQKLHTDVINSNRKEWLAELQATTPAVHQHIVESYQLLNGQKPKKINLDDIEFIERYIEPRFPMLVRHANIWFLVYLWIMLGIAVTREGKQIQSNLQDVDASVEDK